MKKFYLLHVQEFYPSPVRHRHCWHSVSKMQGSEKPRRKWNILNPECIQTEIITCVPLSPADHGFTHLCDYSQQSHKKGKIRKGLSLVNRRFRHCPLNQPLPFLDPLPPEQQMESQHIPAPLDPQQGVGVPGVAAGARLRHGGGGGRKWENVILQTFCWNTWLPTTLPSSRGELRRELNCLLSHSWLVLLHNKPESLWLWFSILWCLIPKFDSFPLTAGDENPLKLHLLKTASYCLYCYICI